MGKWPGVQPPRRTEGSWQYFFTVECHINSIIPMNDAPVSRSSSLVDFSISSCWSMRASTIPHCSLRKSRTTVSGRSSS